VTDDVERMSDLFRGFRGAHGTHGKTERNPDKHDKLEIKKTARTVFEPVSRDLWEQHLSGTRPIGIIAITEESTSWWGCIDVDRYDIDHGEVARQLRDMKLPLLVCRTKSGGAHLYLFVTEPVSAAVMQAKLRDLAALLGFGGSEIFPKQTELLAERGDRGNWLNMPYFGGDSSERYCVTENGRGITLRQFLARAEASRQTPEQLIDLRAPQEEDKEFRDGPPCLQHLATTSFPQGSRNNGLFAVGVFMRKKYPDIWEDKIDEINQKHMDPPLSSEEVQQIKKSLRGGKDYKYKCSDIPLVSHCNAALCRTRKFGVGASGTLPAIDNLAKLDTDEPIWFLDVSGRRVELTTVELQTPLLFQRKCMDVINVMVPVLKKSTWDTIVQGLYENMTIIEAPDEISVSGQFMEHLETFCTDRHKAQTRDEIILGKAWHDPESHRYYFRIRDVQEFLDRVKFRGLTRTQMMTRIKDNGGGAHFFNIKGRGTNVFWMPEEMFSEQDSTHDLPPATGEEVL